MKKSQALRRINRLLYGSGVEVNGSNPWDIQIKLEYLIPFYHRIIRYNSKGLGDSYVDKWWTCKNKKVDEFVTKILNADLDKKSKSWRMVLPFIKAYLFNLQTPTRSLEVAKRHYDLPIKMYEAFLDPYNQYTCGYFEGGASNLNEAQIAKMRLICKKLHLSKEDHLLDIGCGWGGFAKFAAENYGCRVTGITISKEQIAYARKFTAGLPVEIIEMDYRKLVQKKYKERFSKILVCGMIEHVGYKNYRKFMRVVSFCLKNDGLFLLHTIAGLKSVKNTEPWIEENIFPNSMLPSLKQLAKATEGLFKFNDLQNLGFNYDLTLMAWHENLQKNWPSLKFEDPNYYNEKLLRTMEWYFLSCAASFRAGKNQLYQLMYTKNLMRKYFPVR